MNSIYDFIITPKNGRYNNKINIDGKELIVNASVEDHKNVSRHAVVKSVPLAYNTSIKVGDEIIIHHNIFRRWYDIRGVEKNGRAYYKENKYFVRPDLIFLYKQNNKWIAPEGYCFVKPIISNNILLNEKEIPLRGIIKHVDKNLKDIYKEDLVGFTPSCEYEFIIDGKRMYRVPTNSISIKYERQGNEKEYNPSWTKSC